MTDLVLAILHHLLIFSLVAVLAMEISTIRPGLTVAQLARIGPLDTSYGGLAAAILIVGFARVFFGPKGPEFYLTNWVFWAKIAAFVVVGLLSVPPTLRIIDWRRKAKTDAGFAPSADEVLAVRRFLHAEAAVFVLIPIFAAAMARGYGV